MDACPTCGFVAEDYDRQDAMGTLRALAPIWRTMTEGLDASVIDAVLVHARTTRDALAPSNGGDADSLRSVLIEMDKSAARLQKRDLDDPAVLEGVHAGTHEIRLAGRVIHALGAGAPAQMGSLVQVNASGGGVPKAALERADVDRRGVVGDRQAERLHHGKPMQALSLWSAEVIDALRAEGHPVYAGAAGENLTVAGIDWTTIRPGVQLSIGDVRAEISAFATPCAKNAQWFSDRDFRRIDHTGHPGWSRAYAWVIEGGSVAPGDAVLVEPG